MTAAEDNRKHADDPWTKPGTAQPEKRPGPFAQDPSRTPAQDRSRTPPSKEQRRRDYEKTADDEMDAVMRDAPL
jgi:hypothetical protein